jgi:Tfp pilus assembly protein PilF
MNEMKLAENHFGQAIGIDPTLSDPYYNLSRIYQKQGERKKALELYQKAIINGGDPDNDFERQLGS